MVEGAFGASGSRVVLEERLTGTEVSAHAFCDGERAVPMVFACDYKRVRDNDDGPNTGGMGAYSPPGFVDTALAEQINTTVTRATVAAMAAAGRPYRGTLYPGLMLTASGPRVIEFNCRFGDPETQVLIPRLDSDLLPVLEACARGSLAGVNVRWSERAAVGVVLASGGYPGPYVTGLPITGLDTLYAGVLVFHAGTTLADDGTVLTNGGRVLTVVATARTLAEARERVYGNARRIRFEGVHYRTDIALRELTPAGVGR
jgi:phosphoribosylamine--glycine ligase